MSLEVSIDDYADHQHGPLFELFASYCQPDDRLLTAAYTRWLYAENPYGLAKMVKAVEGDRWVGYMAMIPVELVRRGQCLRAYYVVNVLVHPEYQGRYIFGNLIKAAKEFVLNEDSILMGHPNEMALKQWQRSGMHFQEVLRPSLFVPKLFLAGAKSRQVKNVSELRNSLPTLQEQSTNGACWRILTTQEYIDWRYFKHPTNSYLIKLIECDGLLAGFVVSKRMRLGLNLLVDHFLLDQFVNAGLGCLPWLTVGLKSESATSELMRSLWLLPFKKRIPFFFTHYSGTYSPADVMNIGLSASDF